MTIDASVSAAVAGLTISGGGATFGGGILNESGATLTLKNSAVSDNMAVAVGGGIYNQSGATLTVADSTLAGNTAMFSGGAMVNPGGTVSLKNVTVTGNHSLSIGGVGNGGTMIVSDSTVTGNNAPFNGGGIFNNLNGVLTVSDSTVSGNSAGGFWGRHLHPRYQRGVDRQHGQQQLRIHRRGRHLRLHRDGDAPKHHDYRQRPRQLRTPRAVSAAAAART